LTGIKNNRKFGEVEKKFVQEHGLPFKEILAEETIRGKLEEYGIKYRKRILTPIITIWAFLSQILDGDSSCRKATGRIKTFLLEEEIGKYEVSDSGYCQARERLDERVLRELACTTGNQLSQSIGPEHLWRGRRVIIVDGSSFVMADSEANQACYPEWHRCVPGCGFPIARLVTFFCFSTGAVLQTSIKPMKISERAMMRNLYAKLSHGEILLGDSGCYSYADIALLKDKKVDSVFRMSVSKKVDFTDGKIICEKDHIQKLRKKINGSK